MPRFGYVARNKVGHKVSGSVEADSSYAVISMLKEQGLTVLSLGKPQKVKITTRAAGTKKRSRGKIKIADLADFCRQLATLTEAGLSLTNSLRIIAKQTSKSRLEETTETVREDVETGQSFPEALSRHPKVFPILFVAMAEAGAKGGGLATILSQLASFLEAKSKLTRKIKAATTYPLFISIFFFLVVLAVMFFLIPKFEDIFASFDVQLPLLTRVMISISRLLINYLIYEIVGVFLLGLFFYRWSHSVKGRYAIDNFKLNIPIFGKLSRKENIARLCQTLAILVHNGVSLVDSLRIVAKTTGNVVVEQALESARTGTINGASFSDELQKRPLFPQMLVGMVAAGEESGTLPLMLRKVSDFYTSEVETAVDGLSSIIEPVLIAALGGVVTVVVLAIYLPIFKMATAIH